jgi:hypothetical protein
MWRSFDPLLEIPSCLNSDTEPLTSRQNGPDNATKNGFSREGDTDQSHGWAAEADQFPVDFNDAGLHPA